LKLANPLILFLGIWSFTYFLFSLHLSDLLIDDADGARYLLASIILPFAGAFLIVSGARWRFGAGIVDSVRAHFSWLVRGHLPSLTKKLAVLSGIWVAITLVEIVVSKGIPILWLITGSNLSYLDFGIPSVHGFTNSLLLASALVSLAVYFETSQRKFLILPIGTIIWALLVISRNLLLVSLLQNVFLWLRYRAENVGRSLAKGAALAVLVLYVFGVVGDLRTGADNFLALAAPTFEVPKWLPSGFLWAYIYLVTPLNNMLFNLRNVIPLNTGALPNTFSLLLPSILRDVLLPPTVDANSGLVTQAFNVGSAFIGPYQDAGMLGVAVYSGLCGFISAVFWYKRSLFGYLGYCVFAQCIFFSNFFNHFLNLPVIFQFVWLAIYSTRFRLPYGVAAKWKYA
jgi:oligosaccharide repeat unit polymerase